MKKTYILFFLLTFSFTFAFAQVEGTWKMSPQAAALGVGPALGDISWWSNSEDDVATRACYFDDKYVFAEDGTFTNVQDGETWLEGWQGPEGCGTPVAPHDGSNAATWTYDDVAGTITLDGVGAYLGLPKVYNGGELGDPADAPASIIYPVEFNTTGDTMTINIEIAGGAYWRFILTTNAAEPPPPVAGTWKMSPQAAALGVGPALGDISWWSNSEDDVLIRACYFNDEYIFAEDGTFSNVMDGETWIEQWQGMDPPVCGTPVAPHDGSNAATWTYDDVAGTITLNGVGAYLGLAKVYNGGELGDPADAPASIIYPVEFNTAGDTMTINIEIAGGAYWRFILTTNAGEPPPLTVTFSVNMSYQVTMGNFDPANDFMDIAGSFNNWGDPAGDQLTAGTGDVYSVTLDGFAADDALEFKFRINGDWSTSEFPDGGPNRTYTVVEGANTVSVWYNDEKPPPPEGGVMADFEDETWGILTPHVMGCGEYDDDAIHAVDETFMIVDNPDATGINTSSKVLKFIRRGTDNGGQGWGGFWANCSPNVDATDSKYVHFMVWKQMVSPVKFKLEGDPTLEVESMYPQTAIMGWQDMVFDFSTLTGDYPIVALMPDFQDPFETAGDVEMYIDNIVINSDPNPVSGIWNNNADDPISMYPNPFTNSINIELTNDMKSLVISNTMGQQVFQLENVEKGTVNIDASVLRNGVYIITLTDSENKTTSAKMMKK